MTGLLMYFNFAGGDSRYGEWALYNDLTVDTVKSLAVQKVADICFAGNTSCYE